MSGRQILWGGVCHSNSGVARWSILATLPLLLWLAGPDWILAGEPKPDEGKVPPAATPVPVVSAGAGGAAAGKMSGGIQYRAKKALDISLSAGAGGTAPTELQTVVSRTELAYPDRAKLPPDYKYWLPQLQPRASSSPVAFEIGSGRDTVIGLTHPSPKGREGLTVADLGGVGSDLDGSLLVARLNADALWDKVQTEVIEKSGVAVGYRLRSKGGEAASVILGMDFLLRFEGRLGSRLFVIAPSADQSYVFSTESGAMDSSLREMEAAYQTAAAPVSLEIFEVTPEHLQAVGTLKR